MSFPITRIEYKYSIFAYFEQLKSISIAFFHPISYESILNYPRSTVPTAGTDCFLCFPAGSVEFR